MDKIEERDRPAREIDVTPEMIEAGIDAYWGSGIRMETADKSHERELFTEIFRAMTLAYHAKRKPQKSNVHAS